MNWRVKNALAAASPLLIIVVACILYYVFFNEVNSSPTLKLIFDGIIGTTFGIVLINLTYNIISEKEAEINLKKNLAETIQPRRTDVNDSEPPFLYKTYRHEAIGDFLVNSLDSYCANRKLARGFFSYIKGNCDLIKRKEEYSVTLFGDEKRHIISQSLRDTRIFPKNGEKVVLKSYFVLKNEKARGNKLDKIMSENTWFFRENIDDQELVGELIRTADDKRGDNILRTLKYRVEFFSSEDGDDRMAVGGESFRIRFDRDDRQELYGIAIECDVPDGFIEKDQNFFGGQFIKYTARISVEYPIPSGQNTFHTVYAYPTAQASFSFSVEIDNLSCHDIEYMSFISLSADNYDDGPKILNDGKVVVRKSSITFDTTRIIFPRSGFTFVWNNKEKS